MIQPSPAEQPTILAERREPDRPLTPIFCPRCRQRVFEASLTVGSVVKFRCHQTLMVEGKRVTCGYVVRVMPSR
jgi:hypothetical protein